MNMLIRGRKILMKHLKRRMKSMMKKLQSLKLKVKQIKIKGLPSFLRIFIVSLLLAASMLSAPHMHSAYLISKVGSNTVFITNPKGGLLRGSATGFEVIAPSGKVYTLTNQHVCELGKDGIIMVEEKRHSGRLVPKKIIEVWAENDLCLIEGLDGYEGLSLADEADIGDLNFTLGYPLGEALNLSSGFLKELTKVQIVLESIDPKNCTEEGMSVSKIETFFGPMEFCVITRRAMSTNIPTYPGNSGSAMVNMFGHVTGVIFASSSRTAWGSAVPLSDVKEFLKPY